MSKPGGSISSKKLIVLIMMIFTLPFTAFLLVYNFYTVNKLDSRIEQANLSRVTFYLSLLEEDLRNMEKYMANMVANDRYYGRLRYELTPLEAHLYTADILDKYRDILSTQKTAGGLFIYTDRNELYRKAFRADIPAEERRAVDDYLRELTRSESKLGLRGWFRASVGEGSYLFRVLGDNGLYAICMVDLNRILLPGLEDAEQENSYFLYSSAEGEALTNRGVAQSAGLLLKGTSDRFYLTGSPNRYFMVQSFSEYAGINLVYATRHHNLLGNLDPLNLSLLIASVVLVGLLLLCFWLLKRHFFEPLGLLTRTIDRIRGGHTEAKMTPPGRIEEFKRVSEAFNALMEQTRQLKIVAYERKLEAHRTRLQYLQIQIRPHFYLNVLKNLYGMAENGNYKQIQEMILVLSEYWRALIREQGSTIPLKTELKHVETYVQLQQMSLSVPIVCTIEADAGLAQEKLPPLSVLTFVENAVKHGMTPGAALRIGIKARLLQHEDGEYINITVRDNGPGFTDEMLRVLNAKEDEAPTDDGRHIGIVNVKRRFSLLYGSRSQFFFTRSNGACVEIFVPYRDAGDPVAPD